MKIRIAVFGWALTLCLAQSSPIPVIVNRDTAKWVHERPGSPDTQSVVLREDSAGRSLELLASYPGGHVFAPHWHDANERIVLMEGRLSVGITDRQTYLEPGGYAYLPARETQRLSCVSKGRCVFYVYWDGNPASHAR